MTFDGTSTMRMRSIYVSPVASFPIDVEAAGHSSGGGDGNGSGLVTASNNNNNTNNIAQAPPSAADGNTPDKFIDNSKPHHHPSTITSSSSSDGGGDPLLLPQSTHSLLFIERACSIPFWFSSLIAMTSFACLGLAFENNVVGAGADGNLFGVPANVSRSVRAAQYLSIFVTLLMEEEIPTGLYLLRQIQMQDFRKKFPTKKYAKFVLASLLRILNGYFFLINVFVVLIQANEVIAIFYDVLALQFVQQLDDISFSLAKIDVLGNRLRRACTAPVFHAEFKKHKNSCQKSEMFLKALYFLNLGVLLAGMGVVSYKQISGRYQCNSITVSFGDEVWEPAFARLDSDTEEYEEWTLVFSYFNGMYVKDGTHASRPVYKEMRKFDRNPYQSVIPAEIRYCKEISAWVFTHENIRKSDADDELGCNWLLRSPQTDEFDLMNVGTDWSIWTGVIGKTQVSFACNKCSDNTDCNLNGQCIDGECKCNNGAGVQYLGTHCETKLSDSCRTIVGEIHAETFSIEYYSSTGRSDGPLDMLFQEYSRPVYTYIGGDEDEDKDIELAEDDILILMYSGSRWFGMWFSSTEWGALMEDFKTFIAEFHAFWNRAYSSYTYYVSDPTQNPTPVGVDWYRIGEEKGSQYGPFGALYPAQLYNQTGRGFFRCSGSYIPPKSFSDRELLL